MFCSIVFRMFVNTVSGTGVSDSRDLYVAEHKTNYPKYTS